MKITIDVNEDQVSGSIVNILNSLDTDGRKEIAKSVILNWLNEPFKIESQIIFNETLDEFRKKGLTRYSGGHMNDDELIKDYRFNGELSKKLSSKEIMIATIRKEALTIYRTHIKELIDNDQVMKDQLVEISKDISKDFPKYVQSAMSNWFLSHMQDMQQNIEIMMGESAGIKERIENRGY
jgi:hypothetical protein